MDWTTKLSDVVPEALGRYGVNEIHCAYFLPPGYPGAGPAVSLGLPECELQLARLGSDGEPFVIVNRPKVNRDAKHWIRFACRTALDERAAISFNCDTLEQLEQAVRLAQRRLPKYERAALERMADAAARSKRGLS